MLIILLKCATPMWLNIVTTVGYIKNKNPLFKKVGFLWVNFLVYRAILQGNTLDV